MPYDDSNIVAPPVVAVAQRPTQAEIDAFNASNPDQDMMAYGNLSQSASPIGRSLVSPATQNQIANTASNVIGQGAQEVAQADTRTLPDVTLGLAAQTLGMPGDLLNAVAPSYTPDQVAQQLQNLGISHLIQIPTTQSIEQGLQNVGLASGKQYPFMEGVAGAVLPFADLSALKELPAGMSLKDVSPVEPIGNLNLTPRITESHFTGPDEQPIQDLLAKAKQIPGVTKEGLANATEALQQYDPKTKMSKAEFVSKIQPSKFSKVDLTYKELSPEEEAYHEDRAANAANNPAHVLENVIGFDDAYTDDLIAVLNGDIDFSDLPRATRTYLRQNNIYDPIDLQNMYEDAQYEALINQEPRWLSTQRVVPKDHPDYNKGYFELGITNPDLGTEAGAYKHYDAKTDPANMLGHVRGTHIKEPMTIDNTVGEPITLPANTVIVEESQSDALSELRKKQTEEKNANRKRVAQGLPELPITPTPSVLHQAPGVLIKAAIQHAAEQGADYVAIPNSRMIGFPDDRLPKRGQTTWSAGDFHVLMDSEIPKTAINDAKKIPGMEVHTEATQMPGHRWTNTKDEDWVKGLGLPVNNSSLENFNRIIKELASSPSDIHNSRVYSDLGAPRSVHHELEGYLQGDLEFGDLSRPVQDFLSAHNYTRKAFREEVASMKHAIHSGWSQVHPHDVLNNLGFPSYTHDDVIKFQMDEKPFDDLSEDAQSWLAQMYVKKIGTDVARENPAYHAEAVKNPEWFHDTYNKVEAATKQSKSKFGNVDPKYMDLLKSKGYDMHTEEGVQKFGTDLAKIRDQRNQELTDIYNLKDKYKPYTLLKLTPEARQNVTVGTGQRTPGYKKGGSVKSQKSKILFTNNPDEMRLALLKG